LELSHVPIKLTIYKPDGTTHYLELDSLAEIRAEPALVYEFPDFGSSQIDFKVGGVDGADLIIVLPDGRGRITMRGFQQLLDRDDRPTLWWGGDGLETRASGAETAAGSSLAPSLIDSLLFNLTNMSLEGLMNLRVRGSGIGSEDAEPSTFALPDPFVSLPRPDDPPNDQGNGDPPANTAPNSFPGAAADIVDAAFGNPSLTARPASGEGGSEWTASTLPDDSDSDPNHEGAGAGQDAVNVGGKSVAAVVNDGSGVGQVNVSVGDSRDASGQAVDNPGDQTNPANDAPVAAADGYTTVEDTALTVNAALGVLGNDGDVDGDGLTVSGFDAASANGGTVAMNPDGSFTYTPAANFSGADSFSYTVADGNGGSASATVTVTVTEPVDVLDGTLVTNTSGGDAQSVILTVVSAGHPVNAHAKLYILDGGGQEGNVLSDAGFDIAAGGNLQVALEDAGSVNKTLVTDLDLENVEIHEQNDDGVSKLRSDADITGSPNDHFAFTAVVTPDDPATPGNDGAVVQDVTYSTDGTRTGATPNDDALSNPGAAFDYLWGGGGDDGLTGGAGSDQLLGGAGDDLLVFDPADLVVDGGAGTDILRIDIDRNGNFSGGADNDVDLTGNATISNIEAILLTEDGASDANVGLDLTISAQDVLNFTDGSNELHLVGSAGDTANIGGGWTLLGSESVNGANFDIYTQNVLGSDATLKVEDDVTVIMA
jgi:hypothetical protein